MTDRKNTKKALFASVISMLLCVTMLIGSTFAWFTDNASTSVNSIQSGTLKIGLYTNEDCTETAEGKTLSFTKGGDNVLWEPGATWTLPTVYIKNEGNLAVKYIVEITGINGDAKLNEVIDWTISTGIADGETEGHLTAGATQAITISGTMQTTAGNDYQGLTIDGIGITVRATQDTVEYDSTTNQYDKDAAYQKPLAKTEDLSALFAAAADGSTGDVTITLDDDYDGTGWTSYSLSNYNGVHNITINGNGHTIYNLSNPLLIGAWGGSGTITVSNLTIADADISGNYNSLGVGAIMAYYEGGSGGNATFTNCKLINSKVTSENSYAGGLVGYYSKDSVTFDSCQVINSTITGKRAGGLVGAVCNSGTFTNNTVTGCTMTGTYDGLLAGSAMNWAGTVTISGTTQSGNNITDLIGGGNATIN